jgi:hypothetical protein
MAFAVLSQGMKLVKDDQWDANRYRPRYESDSDDSDSDDSDDRAVGAAVEALGVSPVPRAWLQDPTGAIGAARAAAARAQEAAVGAATAHDVIQQARDRLATQPPRVGRPTDPRLVPPPQLFESQPIRRTTGYTSDWGDVGDGLQNALGRQEADRQRQEDHANATENARRVGLRQASIKEHQLITEGLSTNFGGEALRAAEDVDLANEAAKAFLWSHNIVTAENGVKEQSMLRTCHEGSNPYTNYQAGADNEFVFAMPTSGDSGTLEQDFVEIVPQRSLQQRKGFMIDPRTNLVAAIYEDLPPPPQVDYSVPEELRDADRSNRHLVRLQGGWDPHNPGPTRREWEADTPLPESTNDDAAFALERREMQYRQVASDIAGNKAHMFPEAVDDRHPVGYVGYQNETPYADRLNPVPATLRGFVGSEFNPNNRQPEDFRDFGPARSVAQAALDCQMPPVGRGDSKYAYYARPTPVGLHEVALGGAIYEPPKRAGGQPIAPGVAQPTDLIGAQAHGRTVEPRTAGELPVHPAGTVTAVGAAAVPHPEHSLTRTGEMPGEAGRAVALDVAAPKQRGLSEQPLLGEKPSFPVRLGATKIDGPAFLSDVEGVKGPELAAMVRLTQPTVGQPHGPVDGAREAPLASDGRTFPVGVQLATVPGRRVDGGHDQPGMWQHEISHPVGMPVGETAAPTRAAHEDTLREQARPHHPLLTSAVVHARPADGQLPEPRTHGGDNPGRVERPQGWVPAAPTVGQTADPMTNREMPAAVGKALGHVDTARARGAPAPHVRAKCGVSLGAMRENGPGPARDRSRHNQRVSGHTDERKPERVMSPRAPRPEARPA